ncbi:L,D-transpeptidase family protein [Flammeovirga sp. MY04]|uniref:L,D-transpeptidase family protein n=1 Tax=Flammeovirga sp. MY04 TaxID=1191459 RepID=UPI0008061F19|nr:L,D-transpeptidase family protein [Flammeovirga sp. MY04]ANQ47613.1 L,D-transpeptidase family protein [Flammeovirga sp. MY04]
MLLTIRYLFLIISLIFFSTNNSFKEDQLRYSRVRNAYNEKENTLDQLLEKSAIKKSELNIYLRAFKSENLIELWGKNASDTKYKLIKTYEVCNTSGRLGPKRMQGDYQIPEGFYHIDRFNPYSNYHLSLGINYPNASDKILGEKGRLGGDIFIHGACVTIGCLPITDEQIKELYIFCVEAKNNGQYTIPVTIFPAKLSDTRYQLLSNSKIATEEKVGLWSDLKKGYQLFNDTKTLPSISFKNDGRHIVN